MSNVLLKSNVTLRACTEPVEVLSKGDTNRQSLSWFESLTMTIMVLFTIIFAGLACDSASGDNNNGSAADDSYVNNDENGQPNSDVENPTGDDTINVDTVNPLEEYYWLEGTWKRDTGYIADVTVKAWDDELGAEVWGFKPLSNVYVKKNQTTSVFELSGSYSGGGWAKGIADPLTLIVKFTTYFADSNETIDVEYHKI